LTGGKFQRERTNIYFRGENPGVAMGQRAFEWGEGGEMWCGGGKGNKNRKSRKTSLKREPQTVQILTMGGKKRGRKMRKWGKKTVLHTLQNTSIQEWRRLVPAKGRQNRKNLTPAQGTGHRERKNYGPQETKRRGGGVKGGCQGLPCHIILGGLPSVTGKGETLRGTIKRGGR